jgi:hypothetical protein
MSGAVPLLLVHASIASTVCALGLLTTYGVRRFPIIHACRRNIDDNCDEYSMSSDAFFRGQSVRPSVDSLNEQGSWALRRPENITLTRVPAKPSTDRRD